MTERNTLRCSQTGIEQLDAIRRRKGWNRQALAWATAASTSVRTLRRVWQREAIRADAFVAILQAVGVDDWRVLAEADRDYQNAPDIPEFFGRTAEVEQLQALVVERRTPVVALLGMGGLGKTALALEAARGELGDRFDVVLWQSLREAPPLLELLAIVVPRLAEMSGKPHGGMPPVADGGLEIARDLEAERTAIAQLCQQLQGSRCLLILDNAESLLEPGSQGQLKLGYAGYADLFAALALRSRPSCTLLTSRELPACLYAAELQEPVASLSLDGLDRAARDILLRRETGQQDDADDLDRLIALYGGNPKALQIVASYIQRAFDGSISDYLASLPATGVLPELRSLLSEHLQRLAPLEQAVLDWLAIEREPVTIERLNAQLTSLESGNLVQAISLLRDRCLIEKVSGQRAYTLQHAVAECLLDTLVERYVVALARKPDAAIDVRQSILDTHPLLKAQAPRYQRVAQERALAQPILTRLVAHCGTREATIAHLWDWLAALRQSKPSDRSYAAGNLLNLLRLLGAPVVGADLSGAVIRQVYWSESDLSGLNLRGAIVNACSFPQAIDSVLCFTFSPDGRYLATGDDRRTIRLWDLEAGVLAAIEPQAHSSWIRCLAFSADSRYLASGGGDAAVRLWEIPNDGTLENRHNLLAHEQEVWSLAWIPGDQHLVSSGDDGRVAVWNAIDGSLERTLTGQFGWVRYVAADPDGQHVYSASMPKQEMWQWDWRTGAVTAEGIYDDHVARSIAASADGRWLVTGSEDSDCVVRLYSLKNGLATLEHQLVGHAKCVWSVAFSPDSRILATGGADRRAILWDVETGAKIRELGESVGRVRSLAFSADGRNLAAGSDDRGLLLWNYQTGQATTLFQGYTYRTQALLALTPDEAAPLLATLPGDDGRDEPDAASTGDRKAPLLFFSGGDDSIIRLWRADRSRPLRLFVGHQGCIRHLAYDAKTQQIVSCSNDCTTRFWSATSGQCTQILRGHRDWTRFSVFLPGDRLLTAGDDRSVKLWARRTGRCLHSFELPAHWFWALLWRAGSQTLVSADEPDGVRVIPLDANIERPQDAATPTALAPSQRLETGHVKVIALSPDERFLASGRGDGCLQLWDLKDGTCLATADINQHLDRPPQLLPTEIPSTERIRTASISPDGRLLVAGSDDGSLSFYDLPLLSLRRHISNAHDQPLLLVQFDRDGTTAISTAEDETIGLWEVETGASLRTIAPPRLCDALDLTGVKGLTVAERMNLQQLGAFESKSHQPEFPR